MNELIEEIVDFLIERKVTIEATEGGNLVVTDHEIGEAIMIKDLGYPI